MNLALCTRALSCSKRTCWLCWMKVQGIPRVIRIYPLSTLDVEISVREVTKGWPGIKALSEIWLAVHCFLLSVVLSIQFSFWEPDKCNFDQSDEHQVNIATFVSPVKSKSILFIKLKIPITLPQWALQCAQWMTSSVPRFEWGKTLLEKKTLTAQKKNQLGIFESKTINILYIT